MDEYPRRSKNSYVREAISMQAQFLQNVYDLAGCKDLSQEEQDKALGIAATVKDFLPTLESMMGEDTEKKKEENAKNEAEDDNEIDDDFEKALLNGIPKNAKIVKVKIKGAKA